MNKFRLDCLQPSPTKIHSFSDICGINLAVTIGA